MILFAFVHPSRIGDDDVDAGEELARLHEGERVRRAPLRQRHAVVPQRAQVAIHRRRVGRGGALQAPEGGKAGGNIYFTSRTRGIRNDSINEHIFEE